MTHSRLATLTFTVAMLIAAAPALAGNRSAGQVTPRTLRIEELGPKFLLHRGAHWPRLHDIRAIDHPLTKHVTLQQELMIVFQLFQRFIERTRQTRHVLQFFWRKIVDILVEWRPRIDPILNAV